MVNDTFVNYQDNATRKTGAVSYLMYTSFGVSTENSIERAKFVNAKPVYFPPMERKWGNDNGSSAAWKVAAIHDKDGSVERCARFLHSHQRRRLRQHRSRRASLSGQARLERHGVQGRCRTLEFCRARRRRIWRRSAPSPRGLPALDLLLPPQVPVLVYLLEQADLLLQADLLVPPVVRRHRLLSRPSFSAAMARTTP